MSTMHFCSLSSSIQQTAIPSSHKRPLLFPSRSRGCKFSISSSAASADISSLSEQKEPEIELEFLGPNPAADGSFPPQSVRATSGEKLLRTVMLEEKIDLYATYGKVMNCGGGGSCGTCIVEILEGKELLNERTDTELRHLKKKPESWRLACQTIVGNKENSGKVVVQRLPQWKK